VTDRRDKADAGSEEAGGWLLLPATPDHVFRTGADEEQWNKLITEVTLGKWIDPERMPEDPTVN